MPLTIGLIRASLPSYFPQKHGVFAECEDWLSELAATHGAAVVVAEGIPMNATEARRAVAELRDKQTEYEEKYLPRTDEEYREEAYDNLRDSLQDYMGRLDSEQREILQVSSHELVRSDGVWLSERVAWIDMLERVLQREPGWQQALRDAIASRDETVSAEYRDTYAHNTAVIYAALAQVINSRSDKQDRRLRGKIDSFVQDLETLIEQGRATQERAAQTI